MLRIRHEAITPFEFESIISTAFFQDGKLIWDCVFEDDFSFEGDERIWGECGVGEC